MPENSIVLIAQYSKNNAVKSIQSIWFVATFGFFSAIFLYFKIQFPLNFIALISTLYILMTCYFFHLISYHKKSNLFIKYFDSTIQTPKLFKGIKSTNISNLNSIEKIANKKNDFGILIGIKNKHPLNLEKRIFGNEEEYNDFSDALFSFASTKNSEQEKKLKTQLSEKAPNETLTLAILSVIFVVVYLIASYGADFLHITDEFVYSGSNQKGMLGDGSYYRLFTAFFLHIGILHLLLNILILSQYGQFAIRTLGTVRFITILLFSSLIGTLGSNIFSASMYSVGASGGIYGLIACYVYTKSKYEKMLPASINFISTKVLISLLIVDLLASIFFFEKIDFTNHIFGFTSALLYCYITKAKLITEKASTRSEIFGCILLILLYSTSLIYFLLVML